MRLFWSVVVFATLLTGVAAAQTPATLPARLIDMHLHVWDRVPPGREFRDSLLAAFDAFHLQRAVASGPVAAVLDLVALAPGRVLGGASYGPNVDLPSPAALRARFGEKNLAVFGEIDAVWLGESVISPHLAPYWDLSQAMNIPAGVFTGVAPARRRSVTRRSRSSTRIPRSTPTLGTLWGTQPFLAKSLTTTCAH